MKGCEQKENGIKNLRQNCETLEFETADQLLSVNVSILCLYESCLKYGRYLRYSERLVVIFPWILLLFVKQPKEYELCYDILLLPSNVFTLKV